MKWELNDQIVPPEEDYFDYKIHEAVFYGLSWVILTKENVSCFEFYDLKVKLINFFLVECHRCIIRLAVTWVQFTFDTHVIRVTGQTQL